MNAILDTSREVLPKTLMVGSVSTIDEPQAEYIMGMGGLSHIWLITGVMGFIMGAGMAMLELIMRPTLLNLKDVEKCVWPGNYGGSSQMTRNISGTEG